MNTTLNIIPLSAIREAHVQHEEDNGEDRQEVGDEFDNDLSNGPFTFGDSDYTLVSVKKFLDAFPHLDAALYNVLSSDEDFKCSETSYVNLES